MNLSPKIWVGRSFRQVKKSSEVVAARFMHLLGTYLLTCMSLACAFTLGIGLYTTGALLLSDCCDTTSFVTFVFVSPALHGLAAFVVLVCQTLLWLPVLIWSLRDRRREILAVAASPFFAASLYWTGAIASESHLPALGIWYMPFGYVGVAALVLAVASAWFFVVDRLLRRT